MTIRPQLVLYTDAEVSRTHVTMLTKACLGVSQMANKALG